MDTPNRGVLEGVHRIRKEIYDFACFFKIFECFYLEDAL